MSRQAKSLTTSEYTAHKASISGQTACWPATTFSRRTKILVALEKRRLTVLFGWHRQTRPIAACLSQSLYGQARFEALESNLYRHSMPNYTLCLICRDFLYSRVVDSVVRAASGDSCTSVSLFNGALAAVSSVADLTTSPNDCKDLGY